MEKPDEKLNAAIGEWQQGDCTVGEFWFPYHFSPAHPITDGARLAASAQADIAQEEIRGYAVISQTCDIVRDYLARPFIEVAPLVEIPDPTQLANIRRGRFSRYAFIPGVADQKLVADLERAATVEKPMIASWVRIRGCGSSNESRALARALSRQRSRFAFPDDYVMMIRGLRERFSEKHEKSTPEGRALRALEEVRVCATPDWESSSVGLYYWFIRSDDVPTLEGKNWAEHLEAWEPLFKASGRYHNEDAVVVTHHDLTAHEYRTSEMLEFDHLTVSA